MLCFQSLAEQYTTEEIEKMLIDAALYSVKEGYRKAKVIPVLDSNDNSFFSINITVGLEDEDPLIDGAIVYPYSRLNEFNGYKEND